MNTCTHCLLFFPVNEDGRKVLSQRSNALSCTGESVHNPAVGNWEQSLGFLNEVRDTIRILENLAQTSTSLQPLCSLTI